MIIRKQRGARARKSFTQGQITYVMIIKTHRWAVEGQESHLQQDHITYVMIINTYMRSVALWSTPQTWRPDCLYYDNPKIYMWPLRERESRKYRGQISYVMIMKTYIAWRGGEISGTSAAINDFVPGGGEATRAHHQRKQEGNVLPDMRGYCLYP